MGGLRGFVTEKCVQGVRVSERKGCVVVATPGEHMGRGVCVAIAYADYNTGGRMVGKHLDGYRCYKRHLGS